MKEKHPDHALLEDLRNKDRHAFNLFYNCHFNNVLNFIQKVFGLHAYEAQDITQEAFVSLWTMIFAGLLRKKKIESISDLKAYLFVTAKNEALRYLKAQGRQRDFFDQYKKFPEGLYADIIVTVWNMETNSQLEQQVKMDKTIQALPPSQLKDILVLHYIHKKAPGEIATLLNTSHSNVNNQIRKGFHQVVNIIKNGNQLHHALQIIYVIVLLCWEKIKNILLP